MKSILSACNEGVAIAGEHGYTVSAIRIKPSLHVVLTNELSVTGKYVHGMLIGTKLVIDSRVDGIEFILNE